MSLGSILEFLFYIFSLLQMFHHHPLFSRPLIQITLLGFVCLCCPGMWNALAGLGAGGSMSSNVGLTDAANSALYGCFAIVGFFAGSLTNTMGVKITLTVNKNTSQKEIEQKEQKKDM